MRTDKKEVPIKKEKITIPKETFEIALAVEKHNFIRYYSGRLERNGWDDSDAEGYVQSRSIEFPLIMREWGMCALSRKNFNVWSKIASSGSSPSDNCNTAARIRRLVMAKNF